MKKISQQQGFTIIETLVAITILMIAIVGPLTIAHKGLQAANQARDQIVASYLAQDAIEYVRNVKENNIRAGRYWLTGFAGCISTSVENPLAYCTLDTVNGHPEAVVPTGITTGISSCAGTSCALYKRGEGYTTVSNGTVPQFSRFLYLVGNQASPVNEAKAIVTITWNNGTMTNQTVYEVEIFNVLK